MSPERAVMPRLRNRLSYRLAMSAVLIAFVLGVCLTLMQIAIDLRSARGDIDDTVLEIMKAVENSAARAAYTLDRRLAQRVLDGVFTFEPILSATITDDFGDPLAQRRRETAHDHLEWLADLVVEHEKAYTLTLSVPSLSQPVGELSIVVDAHVLVQPFFDRAGVLLVSGIVRNMLLALALLTLFYFILTRPLAKVAHDLSGLGPVDDERAEVLLPPRHEHDELGSIVRRFNAVLGERDRANAELAMHRDHLEELVAQRTAEIEKAQAELLKNERLAALGQLVAIVSHELRNPLGTLRNNATVIERQSGDEARVRRACASLERNISRCDALVSDLLDFTRDTALDCRATPIGPWLESVVDEFDFPSTVSVRHDGNSSLELSIDAERLRRAVINVLENACDAIVQQAPPGMEPARGDISISSRVLDGRAEIVFEDDGAGLPPGEDQAVFEPLFSTKSFGVGLGLTVVQQIMERHGGGVDIRNRPQRGTSVTLWLPLARAAC